ncbi:hypothetical protein HK407_05g10030 [Ordospora pajunii]|uniref:uncharacterized protein n=1 Tax=Ordospora pajunii TaxID=3039483 RepID=UPI002952748F|nr:uncharacterized protein HK407_05g10030 [Ordospora pajunii]KAH9411337.1 hypothetical protein HK407_05g10030 [Ordospora pajunii]
MLTGSSAAQIISKEKGYTIKSVASSNTFLIKKGSAYTKAKLVLDLVENEPDLDKIYKHIPFCSAWNISNGINIQQVFHLGDNQVVDVAKPLKLLHINSMHFKICYHDVKEIVCYMNSIKDNPNFDRMMDIYPPDIKKWALESFTGDVNEIGLYCILLLDEENNLQAFLPMWTQLSIEDTSVHALAEYINSVFVESKQKERLIKYLNTIYD